MSAAHDPDGFSSGGSAGEPLPPRDTGGCFLTMARLGCGMAALQILMALAILAAAIVSLLFFR